MSGLASFFAAFRTSSEEQHHHQQSSPPYNQSLASSDHHEENGNQSSKSILVHADANANRNTNRNTSMNISTTIAEVEETKTIQEWKQTYQEAFINYITPRMFMSDGDEDEDAFKTELDFHWAVRFGFLPAGVTVVQSQSQSSQSESQSQNQMPPSESGTEPQTQDDFRQRHNDEHGQGSPSTQTPTNLKHFRKSLIPSIQNAKHKATSISDIDLMTSSLSIAMSSVRLVWKKRKARAKLAHGILLPSPSAGNDQDPSDVIIPFPRSWMLQGPLHQNYKRVMSMEIMEVDIDIDNATGILVGSSRSGRETVGNVARAAFGAHKCKRIRIFFYNYYADAMMKLVDHAERSTRCSVKNSKETLRDKLMISLRNIPAQCILPFHAIHGEQEEDACAHEKVLERDYGGLSSYCICIGGESNIEVEENQSQTRLRFDSEHLEVGVLIIDGEDCTAVEALRVDGNENKSENATGGVKEYIINRTNVDELTLGVKSELPCETESSMVNAYKAMKELHDAAPSSPSSSCRGEQSESPQRLFATAAASKKRKAQYDKHTYTVLLDVHEFHARNANKERKEREIYIHAAVLNFGPPRRTKRNWMMTAALVDDSLPLPEEQQINDNSRSSISQMKLVIFAANIGDFPQIECAGDIIRCHRVLVDEYQGQLQLTAFPWSEIAVCRPIATAIDFYENHAGEGAPLHPTESKDDWAYSTSCLESLNFTRVNELWRFTRKRMSSCPNVDSRYKITNASVSMMINEQGRGGEGENRLGGDLTAIICSVVPYPEDKQTLTSPKGVLRVWDGTGGPRSDKLPECYSNPIEEKSSEEPSEDVLLSLSDVIGKMKMRHGEYNMKTDNNEMHNLDYTKCLCGKVINVVIWEAGHWNSIYKQEDGARNYFNVGKFVRIRNAIAKIDGAVASLHVNVNTLVTPILDSCYEVKSLIISHNQRVQRNHPFNFQSSCLPLRNLSKSISGPPKDCIPVIREDRTLLDCFLAPPPQTFKVAGFRIVDMTPKLEGTSLREICVSNTNFTKFQFSIVVSDPYMDLALVVPNAVAEKLFGMTALQSKNERDKKNISLEQRSACKLMKQLLNTTHPKVVGGSISSMKLGSQKYFILSDVPMLLLDGGD